MKLEMSKCYGECPSDRGSCFPGRLLVGIAQDASILGRAWLLGEAGYAKTIELSCSKICTILQNVESVPDESLYLAVMKG